jgi:hypothetical protein
VELINGHTRRAQQLSLFGELLAPDDPIDQWHGMPEFIQEDNLPLYTIKVHFFSELALRKFAVLTGLKVTTQTQYTYFPPVAKEILNDSRCVSRQ